MFTDDNKHLPFGKKHPKNSLAKKFEQISEY